jgi:polyhydroxyalkanoate synthesis regulator phasin
MPDKTPPAVRPPAPAAAAAAGTTLPVRRHPGHRGADVRDTVAEMAAKAQEISMEAGSKMAAAMKDVIGAAAGISGFSIESARDLVQFMVRRSQMTQDEADKLIVVAEEASSKNRRGKKPDGAGKSAAKKPAAKKPAAKKPAKKKAAPKK